MADAFLRLEVGGEVCRLKLHHDQAPNTCRALEALLPVRSHMVHAKFAGDEMFFMVPGAWPMENPVTQVSPGDIGYYPDRQTVCIFYGGIVPFGSVGLFARLASGPERLRPLGERLWRDGALPVRLAVETGR